MPICASVSSVIFEELTHIPNTHTDRHTDHDTCNICSNGSQKVNEYDDNSNRTQNSEENTQVSASITLTLPYDSATKHTAA